MARKKLESILPINSNTIQRINEAITVLLEEHGDKVSRFIKESDDQKTTVNIALKIDCSESAPTIAVNIRFSETVTDGRVIECDDPAQMNFAIYTDDEAKERHEERKQRAAEDDEGNQDAEESSGGGKKRKKKEKEKPADAEEKPADA